jgi:hypothetical protein
MSLNKILNEDWAEYDNRKIRDERDGKFFACTEKWEVEYLKNTIKKHYPEKTEIAISLAITQCCISTSSPHPRTAFVECVLKRLQLV